MFGLFTRRKEEEAPRRSPAPGVDAGAAPSRAAPGTGISYHPELVGELQSDHALLLELFREIGSAHEDGDVALAGQLLDRFRSVLTGHLLKENVRLYIYLEKSLAGDAASHALVRQFRHEMDGIGKAVVAFVERYRHMAADASLAGSFGADLASVGKVLGERVRNEEQTLYPLYLPNY